jgi:hypothetical protein
VAPSGERKTRAADVAMELVVRNWVADAVAEVPLWGTRDATLFPLHALNASAAASVPGRRRIRIRSHFVARTEDQYPSYGSVLFVLFTIG